MSNKIIIDGIDVSECEHFKGNLRYNCCNYYVDNFCCEENPNCYFKQLARAKKDIDNFDNANRELWQENEKLENATFTLARGLNFQQERADKLENALAEIETLCIDKCRYGKEVTIQDILSIINKTKVDNNSNNYESEEK